jgi:lysophospholipase L1-like esterase
MKIICFGDSNTFGYDPHSLMGGRYPENIRWTGLLKSEGWEVENCGINGLCIPRESAFASYRGMIRQHMLREPADVLTVMLGSNDLLQGACAEDAAVRMEKFLKYLLESDSSGGSGLLLIAPPPLQPGMWVDGPDVIEESELLSEAYRQLACRLGIAFADAGAWNVDISYDGVHFSPEGHAAFAKGLAQTLRDLT